MRAALAAMYWRQGREAAAEAQWEYACDSITVGCSKYQDQDWLYRIRWAGGQVGRAHGCMGRQRVRGAGGWGVVLRGHVGREQMHCGSISSSPSCLSSSPCLLCRRWPPAMCDYLRNFLQLRSSAQAGQ